MKPAGRHIAIVAIAAAAISCTQPKTVEHNARTLALTDSLLTAGVADTLKLGHMHSGEMVVKTITLRNDTDEPLVIMRHETTCHCTSMEYDKRPVKPGELIDVKCTFDSRGVIWLNNDYWHVPGVVRYDAASGRLNVCKSFANQDGLSLTLTSVNSLAEDREGNIWFATNVGPVYISSAEAAAGTDGFTFVQPKIPRNDGSNLADYLLNNIPVKALAIDGANRKWLGTTGNGVYLISSDNMTQLRHFTTENSPLLSDNILSIAIDGATGEVFFGTDRGLCSYMSDATSPAEEMDKDNVYAYPNPVEPGYTGLITVVGLTFDADVKVTTATGYLVAEGRSTGGTFTWDGRDRYGKRVASGVYNIVTAKSDGSKGTVCKVAVVR